MNRLRHLKLVAILVTVTAIYGWLAKREINALAPSSDNVSFTTFMTEMPPPRRLTHIKLRGGGERVIWSGGIANMIVPSGGSCYVFDESGTLLEWSATTGDGESIDNIWQEAVDQQPITIEDATALLNAG